MNNPPKLLYIYQTQNGFLVSDYSFKAASFDVTTAKLWTFESPCALGRFIERFYTAPQSPKNPSSAPSKASGVSPEPKP